MLKRRNDSPTPSPALIPLLLALLLPGCATSPEFAAQDRDSQASAARAASPAQAPAPAGKGAPPAAKRAVVSKSVLAPPADLWERMRRGFALPETERADVQREAEWYARHRAYLDRVAERARYYLHHVVEQVEARGMPTDLALLPVVESAFQPFAYSPARAAGLWQFMPATGRLYGLEQNWWYDGRRDVVASTRAALDYLQKLNGDFGGDWLLAVAAYNSGEGNVLRAIRKNEKAGRPTDFWSLDLPRETRSYVPRLLAITALVNEPERYGVSLPLIDDRPYFAAVDVGGQIDLAMAAEMAEVELDEFYLLNPGFNRWATDPDGPHRLLVPVASRESFAARLADLDDGERVVWRRHRIRGGDTLIAIAGQYGTTVDALMRLNKLSDHRIRAGRSLVVPASGRPGPPAALAAATSKRQRRSPPADASSVSYRVRDGDSLWEIARRHSVSVTQLAGWNGLHRSDVIQPGQSLTIWQREQAPADGALVAVGSAPSVTGETTRRVRYTVRSGDSLWQIARRFNVSVDALRRWNSLGAGSLLQPGQALLVYVDVTGQAESI